MPYPREVRDTFEEILKQNLNIRVNVSLTLESVKKKRIEAFQSYIAAMDPFIDGLVQDAAALEKFSVKTGRDFATERQEMAFNSEEAARALVRLEEKHGTIEELGLKVQKLGTDLIQGSISLKRLRSSIDSDAKKLEPIKSFNASHPDLPQITPGEGEKYFRDKNIWRWLTDKHYRTGRRVLLAFNKKPEALGVVTGRKEDWEKVLEKVEIEMAEKSPRHVILQGVHKNMKEVASRVLQPKQQDEKMRAILNGAMDNRDFFVSAVEKAGDMVPAAAVVARGKIEGCDKILPELDARVQALKQAASKLETPLSKIRTAISRGVHRSIRVDLDDIRKKFAQLHSQSGAQARKLDAASINIDNLSIENVAARRNLSGATNNSLDMITTMLLIDMITPDQINVGGDFSSAVSGLDTQALDFSVPDVRVDMPSLDIGSIDTGSSWGSDIGGGGGGGGD